MDTDDKEGGKAQVLNLSRCASFWQLRTLIGSSQNPMSVVVAFTAMLPESCKVLVATNQTSCLRPTHPHR